MERADHSGPHFRYTHKHSLERVYDALKTNTAYMQEREKVSAQFERRMSRFKAMPQAQTFAPSLMLPSLHEKTHFKSVKESPMRRPPRTGQSPLRSSVEAPVIFVADDELPSEAPSAPVMAQFRHA